MDMERERGNDLKIKRLQDKRRKEKVYLLVYVQGEEGKYEIKRQERRVYLGIWRRKEGTTKDKKTPG